MSTPASIRLKSIDRVETRVDVPGSKSITNRAFIVAALACDQSNLRGVLRSEDTIAMSTCLHSLGVTIDDAGEDTAAVMGLGGRFDPPTMPLFANNSGTTIRFLTAVAALAPAGSQVILDGIDRMRQRPIRDLVEALQQLGITAATSSNGCPPVSVSGGGIRGGRCLVRGNVSSQYLSALLMAAPCAISNTEIVVDGGLVSRPYIDITLSVMAAFGVRVQNDSYRSFAIDCPQVYSGRDYLIEPDASNASYFFAAAAISGGKVTVNNLGTSSIQGDVHFVDVLEQMGCKIDRFPDSITVTGPLQLSAIDVDAKRIPDMAQTIAVVACFANGKSRISGLDNLRVKETDRISAMATELRKLGVSVKEGIDNLELNPPKHLTPAAIDTYDDHRMAMSFTVAGLRTGGIIINDPNCVRKTFPNFFECWGRAFPGSI
jgi:3-phosphoshikimate 1-carboxyvinyltransferase